MEIYNPNPDSTFYPTNQANPNVQPFQPQPPAYTPGAAPMYFPPPAYYPQDPMAANQAMEMMQTAAVTYTLNQQMIEMLGPSLFNLNDPYYVQYKNTPKKVSNSRHWVALFFNIYAIVSIIIGSVLYVKGVFLKNAVAGIVVILLQGYLIYIAAMFCWSDVYGYINNMKLFSQYQTVYDTVVKSQGYFRFHIECYHYENRRDSKGRTKRVRVTTHTATENYKPSQCIDESGALGNLYETKQYVFLHCFNRFYFDSERSARVFDQAWNAFLSKNTRDVHQDRSNTFVLPGFEEEIGFTLQEAGHTQPLYYFFNFGLMGYPYAVFLEFLVARYELTFLKKIVC